MRLSINLAFGYKWELFHWDVSVALTITKAEEEKYAGFPNSFPEDLFPSYTGGTIARLKRKLYSSKSAPKFRDLHEPVLPVTTPLSIFPDRSTLLPSCQSWPVTAGAGAAGLGPNLKCYFPPTGELPKLKGRMLQGFARS